MKTVKLDNIRKNIMGTTSFDMKAGSMRKPQDFIVYPIKKDEQADIIQIQSDNYVGKIEISSGEGILSSRHSNPGFSHLSYDEALGKATRFKLSDLDKQALKLQIFTSTNKKAGNNGVMFTDNSGAKNVLS